jgi:predicted transposase/invertase (TIGR01784 family)
MSTYKPLDELTLMDDYMFGVVMQNPALLKPLLEYILDFNVQSIEYIEPQRTMKSGYISRGIRVDLFVTDEFGNIYNVEVQTTNPGNLPKRMRYYQSVIDINVLNPGADYRTLRKSFIIFICNHDPFGMGKVRYTFENRCVELPSLPLGDETVKVIVNTKGADREIRPELNELIHYMDSGIVSGRYSQTLEDAVRSVKSSEERRHEYMIMMVREQEIRAQGREEGRREQALATFKRLLAMNIPEAQARAMAFGDENEFAPLPTAPDGQSTEEGDVNT